MQFYTNITFRFLDEVIVRAGEEEGELGEYRRKLAYFLKVSDSYSAEKLLVQLRNDCTWFNEGLYKKL